MPAANGSASPSRASSPILDENVQFTIYRPKVVQPAVWYPLLAFAHLTEKPLDAPDDALDPLEAVRRQAEGILGPQVKEFKQTTQDSLAAVPRSGELTMVPDVPGIEFNPPRSFLWNEPVHREFRLRELAASGWNDVAWADDGLLGRDPC